MSEQANDVARWVPPDPKDPYLPLDAHVGTVRAIYCEEGCGEIDTAPWSLDDRDAGAEFGERGWTVRPHGLSGLTPLCKTCAARWDQEYAEDNAPLEHVQTTANCTAGGPGAPISSGLVCPACRDNTPGLHGDAQ